MSDVEMIKHLFEKMGYHVVYEESEGRVYCYLYKEVVIFFLDENGNVRLTETDYDYK